MNDFESAIPSSLDAFTQCVKLLAPITRADQDTSDRNQRVCLQLLNGMRNTMCSMIVLRALPQAGESIAVLFRTMFEQSINLRYLACMGDDDMYRAFVGRSFRSSVIDLQDAEWAEVLRSEGFAVEEIKCAPAWPSIGDRLDVVGVERVEWTTTSSSVHSDWLSGLSHNAGRDSSADMDILFLNGAMQMVQGAVAYLATFHGSEGVSKPFMGLIEEISKVPMPQEQGVRL